MKSPCQAALKIAADLLENGVLPEAAAKLSELHDCGRQAGCQHWHGCVGEVESKWQRTPRGNMDRQPAAR